MKHIQERYSSQMYRGLILILLGFLCSVSQPLDNIEGQEIVTEEMNRMNQSITIHPSKSHIRLGNEAPFPVKQEQGYSPFQGYSKFAVTVQSILPSWGAIIGIDYLDGPAGEVPRDRLWVRTIETGGDFSPLEAPLPLANGDFHLPVKEVPVEVLFRPRWSDPPGTYRFQLRLIPSIPDEARAGKIYSESLSPPLGTVQGIDGEFENNETIRILATTTDIHFNVNIGPGTYLADEEIKFFVWTNAPTWRVDCQASAFINDEGNTIPPDQLIWERLDEYGRLIDSGNFGSQQTVLRGYGPIEEDMTTLRLKIRITMTDPSGQYNGELSLVGSAGS